MWHTLFSDRPADKKGRRKRCVPKIRRRQVCQVSWKSEILSYNGNERWEEPLPEHLRVDKKARHLNWLGTDWLVENGRTLAPSRSSGSLVIAPDRHPAEVRPFFAYSLCFLFGPLRSRAIVKSFSAFLIATELSPWGDNVVRVDPGPYRC